MEEIVGSYESKVRAHAANTEQRGKNGVLYRIFAGNSSWSEKMRNHYGFTLIELLLTLIIVGTLAAIAVSTYSEYIDRSKVAQAESDIRIIESKIEAFYETNFKYPDSLDELKGQIPPSDPWGNPYQYLNITTTKGKGKVRKDHNLVPLNSDYDLYSMGKDGESVSPLTAKASRDDIVRANNGAFVGLASEY